jgi:hypothetical protein
MTSRSTHLILVPGLGCTEELFAEQIASLRGDIAISVADHTRHDTIVGSPELSSRWHPADLRCVASPWEVTSPSR